MPSIISPLPSRRSRFMPLVGGLVAGLWLLVLIVFCVLMLAGTLFLWMSNGFLWAAYHLRDTMEVIGNKVETSSR